MSQFESCSRDVFMVHEFAAPYECEAWIADAETEGFEVAPVTTRDGPVSMPEVRNNARVMRDDPELAAMLWARLRTSLPERWLTVKRGAQTFEACGLNERLRFYRYDPRERFATHRDGYFARDDGSGERSMLTILLYLNEGFEGGQTHILEPSQPCEVEPATGMLLAFAHRLLHEGATITRGRKYVLRTDVMYHPIEAP